MSYEEFIHNKVAQETNVELNRTVEMNRTKMQFYQRSFHRVQTVELVSRTQNSLKIKISNRSLVVFDALASLSTTFQHVDCIQLF